MLAYLGLSDHLGHHFGPFWRVWGAILGHLGCPRPPYEAILTGLGGLEDLSGGPLRPKWPKV